MKFTCIVPSVGRSTLNNICLPSVRGQSVKFDQVIIAFDLPNDTEFELYDDTETVYTGGGLGGPAARKLAYEQAIGDFIVILDDDDSLALDFVENLLRFLNQQAVLPSLVLPRVRKVWPEGLLPNMWSGPYVRGNDVKPDTDLSLLPWMPATSSGLILSRAAFSELPVNERVEGFNDVQICEAARKQDAPIYFCPECIVYFYQYFSIPRLTSNLSSRAEKLQIAKKNGIRLSEAECEDILVSTLFSQARSIAFTHGFLASFQDLKQSVASLPYLRVRYFYKKLILNTIIIVWLSVVRQFAKSEL
jgi:GT2 family glycosyltransferase